MKFARLLSSLLCEISVFGTRNGSHSSFYSSMAFHRPVTPPEGAMTALFRRIFPIGDSKVSILPILNQWVEDGQSVDRDSLKRFIKDLRSQKRYRHALEISIWMTNKRYSDLGPSDIVIRLDLITKSLGIEQAEKYFNKVPQQLKGLDIYRALLNCYETAGCVEKSESVMQKMKDLGFVNNTNYYKLTLNLYYKTRDMEKFNALLQEMEENGIVPDQPTISIQLSAYAAVMDIGGMDKVLAMMESDPKVVVNYDNYTVAAAGYRKAGLLDKTLEMLKKGEAHIATKGRPVYDLLIQYATLGKKDEVLRVWSLYKKEYNVNEKGYMSLVVSLGKLGDFEMAEKILNEWDSLGLTYDIRIPNIVISDYCWKGLFDKADALIDWAISKGRQPNACTWYSFAKGYFEFHQPENAVGMMKRAIVVSEPFWRPFDSNKYFAACLEYLKGVGKMEDAEEFIKMMLDKNIISLDIHEKLLNAVKAKELVQNGALLELMEPEEKS